MNESFLDSQYLYFESLIDVLLGSILSRSFSDALYGLVHIFNKILFFLGLVELKNHDSIQTVHDYFFS